MTFGRLVSCALVLSAFAASGAPSYEVCGGTAPKPWEKTAKEELVHYLELVVRDNPMTVDGADGVRFHVGDTAFAAEHGLSSAGLKDEEWVIRSFGRDVVLNGGGTRGCLYAVYHFLEDQCGVSWWYDLEEDVPVVSELAFPALDRKGKPFFFYRDIYPSYKVGDHDDPRCAVRYRLNGNGDRHIPPEFGGGCEFGPPYHTHCIDLHLPFEKYGAVHPEWYALHDGKRVGGMFCAQMCYTHPDLPERFAESMLKSIDEGTRKAKERGLPPPVLYDLTMNDNSGWCECDRCQADIRRRGHSGHMINLVNKVAAIVGKCHPEIFVRTAAYYEGETLPLDDTKPASNVVITLTNTKQNMAAGIFEADNRFMHDRVREWSGVARNLLIWDYSVTYAQQKGFPFASELYLGEKIRYYADHDAMGMLLEFEYPDVCDLRQLKYHIQAKFLEDPYQDAATVRDGFMRRYYGAAADKISEARWRMDCVRRMRRGFLTWHPRPNEFNFMDDAALDEQVRLWDEAEAAVVADAKRLRRVRDSRKSLERLVALRRSHSAYRHGPEAGVSDRPFVDCPMDKELLMIKDRKMKIVEDGTAHGGKRIFVPYIDVDYKFPLRIGVYNPARNCDVIARVIDKPAGDGWQWYDVGTTVLPSDSFYVFLNRSRFLQLAVGVPELSGGRYDIRVRMRVEDGGVSFDRVVFVPAGMLKEVSVAGLELVDVKRGHQATKSPESSSEEGFAITSFDKADDRSAAWYVEVTR